MDILALIGLGVVLFASTNIDDIFVLLGFFADRRFKAREVVAGHTSASARWSSSAWWAP